MEKDISDKEAEELLESYETGDKRGYLKFPCGLTIQTRQMKISLDDLNKVKCPLHGKKCYLRKELIDLNPPRGKK